jgi:50S ribosomal subunit-associated GTPase HflX
LEKPQVVVLNKIDAQSDKNYLEELKRYFEEKYNLPVFLVSALTGEGLDKLKYFLKELVEEVRKKQGEGE